MILKFQSVYNKLLSWIHLGNINDGKGREKIFLDQIQMLGFLHFSLTHKALKVSLNY